MNFSQYTVKSVDESLTLLESSLNGLSKKEAVLAQKNYGPNEIKVKSINWLSVLARQFKTPFCYLLLIAGLISLALGYKVDSAVIFAFIFINIVIGFIQEFRAEKSVVLLQKFITQRVKVLRDGKEELINKVFLVPGDIVLLEAGDLTSADLRVINLQNFLADESALTGESAPVTKITEALPTEEQEIFRARNIIFSGSSVVSGRAQALVVAIGKDTVFGSIIKSVAATKRESSYEKSILYFAKLILKIVVITISLIFIANILLKGVGDFFELVLFSVALIVSILPEALPVVVTFALSRGSLKMVKQNVVVKRLSAIEDLGNIDILCTDKTGTLTQNKLSLEKIVSLDKKKCFLYGVLSSGGEKIGDKILNPFDLAIYQRAPGDILRESKKFAVVSELPFDSFRMKSAFLVKSIRKGESVLIVKGAPEFILKNCSKFGTFDKKEVIEDVQREGAEGRRVLAIAYKKLNEDVKELKLQDEKGLNFLGYFVFDDPVKTTAKEAMELAKKLGVKIKIITGDSKEVAGFVARRTGLAVGQQDVISGEELLQLQKEEFEDACEEKIIFARISPDLKHKIIKSLQKRHEVGFMGEGVNDAPALKTADVGIAVLEASDVARGASDVVLLQKDLRVIVNGIKDGRAIFSNINKYIKCALVNNFGQFYSMAVISLFINFLPMLPVQILLSNILSDLPMIFIATDDVEVDELRKPKMYELHNVLPLIISLGLVGTLFDFVFFIILGNKNPALVQSLWFVEGLLTDIVLIFIIRTRGLFWKSKKPSLSLSVSTALAAAVIIALPFLKIGQSWFHFVPLPLGPLFIVFGIVVVYFALSEIVKLIYFRYWKPASIEGIASLPRPKTTW